MTSRRSARGVSAGQRATRIFEMEGRRVPVRLTAVLHQEEGDWKAVQIHASIGVPNEQMLDPMFQATG
jgi:hypothetical protein